MRDIMLRKKNEKEASKEEFIKILGTGCRNCNVLEANVRRALDEMGLDMGIGHVTEIDRIVSYGVMQTPSLVFGEEVVSVGKVLSVDEIKQLIERSRRMFE